MLNFFFHIIICYEVWYAQFVYTRAESYVFSRHNFKLAIKMNKLAPYNTYNIILNKKNRPQNQMKNYFLRC